MVKAVGFDLGETLIHHEGIPLSWQNLYRDALEAVAAKCSFDANDQAFSQGEQILARYNTRLNPRAIEVTSDHILGEVLSVWGLSGKEALEDATESFFSFFRKHLQVYEDVLSALQLLRHNRIKIGILTDVPYGMPRRFVDEDVISIVSYIDVLLTSVDVGYRKPESKGFLNLAKCLGVNLSEMVYVGNEPKDIAGAKNAGIFAILIDRDNNISSCGEDVRISSLSELPGIYQSIVRK